MSDASTTIAAETVPGSGARKLRPKAFRSKLTDGRVLLPGVNSQSKWARLFRDMLDVVHEHLGGIDHASELEKLTARRIATLECELRYQEVTLALCRHKGEAPPDELLDLYSRCTNTQKRLFEMIGLHRRQRDVTPDIRSYIAAADSAEPVEPFSGSEATPVATTTEKRGEAA
jgi:hypothetical protein